MADGVCPHVGRPHCGDERTLALQGTASPHRWVRCGHQHRPWYRALPLAPHASTAGHAPQQPMPYFPWLVVLALAVLALVVVSLDRLVVVALWAAACFPKHPPPVVMTCCGQICACVAWNPGVWRSHCYHVNNTRVMELCWQTHVACDDSRIGSSLLQL